MNAPYPQLVEVLRDRRRALGLARDQNGVSRRERIRYRFQPLVGVNRRFRRFRRYLVQLARQALQRRGSFGAGHERRDQRLSKGGERSADFIRGSRPSFAGVQAVILSRLRPSFESPAGRCRRQTARPRGRFSSPQST